MKKRIDRIKDYLRTVFQAINGRKFYTPTEQLVMRRRAGNSTRIIDKCVQEFFEKGECHVQDHHGTRESTSRILRILKNRLQVEHKLMAEDFIVRGDRDPSKVVLIRK